ncbi:alpha-1,6-mannosyltransferase KNAG_0B00120 [Huiozyma naganishii CBS 8797]|uniref:Glycosyltransferase family 32 protein n=1 Tax=Huiozyma naganishii (strain ATCC MYA-139 / BCRC 22969 / CBS 8797 / KCTC 17520 / NBRC 10181 / NCYC 3082 / Yp74L-3) TaxID=1071383 RepID=J7S4B1_HUIN7|nr:hypothetical protein KNAG_0B00120 [Kazachstania naganishii CBS 8797]CCK68461.1 hypothetical protein KNAG_0B00120 [Kazachstania naganishii CBS 8797]
MMAKFELLAKEMRLKQDEQAKLFEKQRRVLERRIKELKKLPDEATLREKLAYAFEYDSSRRFPAFIWQTWPSQGMQDSKGVLVEDVASNRANWDEKNPGFVHEIINDNIAGALVRHYYASIPDVLEAYNSLPNKILKIDFFKYLILLARGGLYADMDTVPLQPIPNWVPAQMDPGKIGLVVGIEHDAKDATWRNEYVRRLQFGTWIIQAKPGHPVIREVVAHITETTLDRKMRGELNLNFRNDLNIMSWTGSGVWTDALFTYFNDYLRSGVTKKVTWKEFHNLAVPKLLSDVLVFPEFSLKAPNKISSDDPNKSMYFATHEGAKFWKTVPKVEDPSAPQKLQ